jgi:hypothetical protein
MWALRGLAAALFVLAAVIEASADPRLVRIIWDVGGNHVYYKAYNRTEVGYGQFSVPATSAAAAAQHFALLTNLATDILQKGDHVRLYVVNYNRVSHVWHESSSIVQIEAEPNIVGPLLNALLLAITGAQALPSQGLTPSFEMIMPPPPFPACEKDLASIVTALNQLRPAARYVRKVVTAVVDEARRAELNGRSRKLAAVPGTQAMWETFDSQAAWQLILERDYVLGFNYATHFADFAKGLEVLDTAVEQANDRLIDVDAAIATTDIRPACVEAAKALVQQRDNIVTFLKEVAGPDSSVRAAAKTYETGIKLWNEFERKLTMSSWAVGAIELALKDPVGANGVLRVDGVFASPVEKLDQRIQRSVVIGIRTHVPVLVISSGVGFNQFDFKTLELKSATDTSGTTVTVKNRLQIVDDTDWDPIVPVWIQSVRLWRMPEAGLYVTFGTTPDRNIFKNAILGGSVYVPLWRTAFTAGMITARGLEEKDLEPVRVAFSDANGFARDGVDVDTLPLPETRWVKSFYVSVSFMLASF